MTRISISGLGPIFFKHANEDQLKHVSPLACFSRALRRDAEHLGKLEHKAADRRRPEEDSDEQRRRPRVVRNLQCAQRQRRTEVVRHPLPTHSAAQDAEMSLEEYENFVFGAMLVDRPDPIAEWQRVSREQERLVKVLDEVKLVEIKGRDTNSASVARAGSGLTATASRTSRTAKSSSARLRTRSREQSTFLTRQSTPGGRSRTSGSGSRRAGLSRRTRPKARTCSWPRSTPTRARVSSARLPSAPTTASPSSPATRSSTRRSAAPCISRPACPCPSRAG